MFTNVSYLLIPEEVISISDFFPEIPRYPINNVFENVQKW